MSKFVGWNTTALVSARQSGRNAKSKSWRLPTEFEGNAGGRNTSASRSQDLGPVLLFEHSFERIDPETVDFFLGDDFS
jgi:hypothetical protein